MTTEPHNSQAEQQLRQQRPDVPTWQELVPVIRGSLPRTPGYEMLDDAVARNVALGLVLHLEARAEQAPEPVDWPARLRAAAAAPEVLVAARWLAHDLRDLADDISDPQLPPHVVDAIGRALLGGQP